MAAKGQAKAGKPKTGTGKKIITIYYTQSPDYRKIPVSGAWGGITPQGYIHADLYAEDVPSPDELKIEVDDKGNVKELADNTKKEKIHRRVKMIGIFMLPIVAKSLGEFLVDKANSILPEENVSAK